MSFFSDSYMAERRKQWLRSIHSIEAQVGGTWHKGTLNQKKFEGDALVIMATFPTLNAINGTITGWRIIDIRGAVAVNQSSDITKADGQGFMIKLTVPVYEVSLEGGSNV